MFSIYKKMRKLNTSTSYFCNKTWQFEAENVKRLWKQMSARDKEIFYTDLTKIDWSDYFRIYVLGVRKFLLGEPDENLASAKQRYNRYDE